MVCVLLSVVGVVRRGSAVAVAHLGKDGGVELAGGRGRCAMHRQGQLVEAAMRRRPLPGITANNGGHASVDRLWLFTTKWRRAARAVALVAGAHANARGQRVVVLVWIPAGLWRLDGLFNGIGFVVWIAAKASVFE